MSSLLECACILLDTEALELLKGSDHCGTPDGAAEHAGPHAAQEA